MPALSNVPRQISQSQPSQSNNSSDRLRALNLLQTEIDFIPNREFDAEQEFPNEQVISMLRDRGGNRSGQADIELPAHLKRMCDSHLLSPQEERQLFREMNLLKYRANALRSRIDPDQIDGTSLDEIESLLGHAQKIREYLIKANMRLVISIVKKFVTPQQSFDDLLSEGTMILMKAVEKFDFDRGFRFSTYAYRSIVRHVYRTVNLARKEEARFTRDAEEWAFEDERSPASTSMGEEMWSNLQELMASMLKRLDRRERFIIRSRYALGSHRKVRSFQYLADKLGVSKERARQLQSRAVAKLRSIAAECDETSFFEASVL
jgi:RNA polymerase primary sigma factor